MIKQQKIDTTAILAKTKEPVKRIQIGMVIKAKINDNEWGAGPITGYDAETVTFEAGGIAETVKRNQVFKCPKAEYEAYEAALSVPGTAEVEKATKATKATKAKKTEDEDESEDEENSGGSVVNSKYKQIYAERGNSRHCGDWLAEKLADIFGTDGLDLPGFLWLCEQNGVDVNQPWAKVTGNGSAGRIRMNGRQKLEIALLHNKGVLHSEGGNSKAPASFMDALRAKHPKHADGGKKVEAEIAAKTVKKSAKKATKKAKK